MNVETIMKQLEAMGSEQTRKTFSRHGAPAKMFGVKVGDMKTIVKQVKKNHELSLKLYETGNSDAMYLAGLIADEAKITAADLERWAKKAPWHMISEYTVAWVAAESKHGWALAQKWIDSPVEQVATAGWSTLANWVSLKPDSELDLPELKKLLARVEKSVHKEQNRVRYTMNNFVIAVGSYVTALNAEAKKVAAKIGEVSVDMGGTACKVPLATEYIAKVESMGRVGKKRKMARC